jgi:hypothetical protein
VHERTVAVEDTIFNLPPQVRDRSTVAPVPSVNGGI